MKDNKLVEKYDDNPGAYFGMLIEGWEDKEEALKEDVTKEWKPNTNFKHIQKVFSDALARGKYINNEREEVFAALDLCDKKQKYTPEQRRFIRDSHEKMWRMNNKKQEAIKENKLNEQSKYLPTNSGGIVNLKKVIEELESKFVHLLKRRPNGESQIQIFPKGHVETNAFGQEYTDRISLIGPDDETVILSLATDPTDEYCVLYRFPELDKKWKKARTVVELFDAVVDKVVNSTNESLKEDKFVPRDKMSKKDKKELDSQKRNTWGSTNPVTRVQPNKKAYDRKRDKKIEDESLEESVLNESSDGWDEDKLYDLKYILDKLENLNYEINNCVRGAYSYCKTYEELGHYISDLADSLGNIGEDVSLYVEDEEDDDED